MSTVGPGRRRFDLSWVLFFIVTRGGLLALVFAIGVRTGAAKTAAYFFWADVIHEVTDSLHLTAQELPTMTGIRPTHFLNPARYPGDGVTVNDPAAKQTDLILLTGYFDGSSEVRMVRRDGAVVARWPLDFYDLFPDPDFIPDDQVPQTNWNVISHGALALPDGSIVVNFEYNGTVKFDRCDAREWVLRQRTHHSVVRASDGGFWIPGRRGVGRNDSPYPPFEPPYQEDLVLHVTPDGKLASEFSVVRLLYDHLKGVLTATGHDFRRGMTWDQEVVHLNKIDELSSDLAPDFPMFEAGDLLLSIRELNLLLVSDPSGTEVKWWQIGPWLRQHDPHFVRGGRIVLFNNNTFETAWNAGEEATPADAALVSDVMTVNPATGRTHVIYGDKTGQEMLSVIRGKVETTPGGGLLITEPDGGRVREVDAGGRVVWEYVNRYDDDHTSVTTQASLYPAEYFSFDTGAWQCEIQ